MKFRGLIIAVFVLLVLGGLLIWSNHHKQSAEAIPSSSAPPAILKLNQAAISQLTLIKKGAAPITLDKGGAGKWQITAPQKLNADEDSVSGMLWTLSNLNADRVVEEKATDLQQYGLADPSETVDITENGHKPQELLLGDSTPAGADVYAKLAGGSRIFTLASYNKTSIDKGLNDLRDKRLIALDPDKVSRAELIKPQQVEFARIKNGWQILKPRPLRADSSAIDDLVRTVCSAHMDLDGPEADRARTEFALAVPVAAVTLTGDRGTQTLELRKKKEDYYAKSTAVEGVFQVDANLDRALDKKLDDFRSKKLFDFGFAEPDKIELHSGTQSWFFTHSGNDWWSNGTKMDAAAVESLVEKLRDLTASSFPEAGFTHPDIEVSVTSDHGKRVETLFVSKSGAEAGGKIIAKRENDPSLYQLDSAAVADLTKAAEGIKAATAAR